MMIIGGVASTPSYWWFSFLGRHFNYSSLPLSLLVKVIVQQSLFAPTFNTYFFAMQAALEGKGPPEVLERVGNTLPDSLLNSVKLWPAVTALNFWLVEARFRMLVAALVAVGWQGYLSYLNSREKRRIEIEHKDQEKQAERLGKTKRKRATGVVKKRDGKAAARNAIAA
jgi:protein Mpv17